VSKLFDNLMLRFCKCVEMYRRAYESREDVARASFVRSCIQLDTSTYATYTWSMTKGSVTLTLRPALPTLNTLEEEIGSRDQERDRQNNFR
jgi:hypothetical protein